MKVVTVHGTFAGLPGEDEGDRWWQRKSAFCNELKDEFGLASKDIIPFHWDVGANSEAERSDYGARLFQNLKAIDEAGEPFFVISHSHGGNVVFHALLEAISRMDNLANLKRWISLGTPFVNFARKNYFLRRFTYRYKALLYALFVAAILYFATVARGAADVTIENNYNVAALMVFVFVGGGVAWLLWRRDRALRALNYSHFFESKLTSIYHSGDEAFFVLNQIQKQQVQLSSQTAIAAGLANTAGNLAILAAIFAIILPHWSAQGINYLVAYKWLGTQIAGYADAYVLTDPNAPPFGYRIAQSVATHAGIFLALFLAMLLLFGSLFVLSYLLSIPLNWLASKGFTRQLRNLIWGWDVADRYVQTVSRMPAHFDKSSAIQLDEATEKRMLAACDAALSKTGARVREMLMAINLGQITVEQGQQIFRNADFKELIHNTYFDTASVRQRIFKEIKAALPGTKPA